VPRVQGWVGNERPAAVNYSAGQPHSAQQKPEIENGQGNDHVPVPVHGSLLLLLRCIISERSYKIDATVWGRPTLCTCEASNPFPIKYTNGRSYGYLKGPPGPRFRVQPSETSSFLGTAGRGEHPVAIDRAVLW